MLYYLQQRLRITKRSIISIGCPIWLAVILGTLLFGYFVLIVRQNPTYAPYALAIFGLSFMLSNRNHERLEFLKTIYLAKQIFRIRLIENAALASPALVLAAISSNFAVFFGLAASVFFMSLLPIPKPSGRAFWYPFYRFPFEVTIHFRHYYKWVLLVSLGLTVIALFYENANMALFVVVVSLFIGSFGYDPPENEYYVWNYALSPKRFLLYKIKRGLTQLFLLNLPMTAMLLILFPERIIHSLVGLMAACLWIVLLIVMKYGVFPRKLSILDTALLLIAALMPIIAPFIGYYYYRKSILNLQKWLS